MNLVNARMTIASVGNAIRLLRARIAGRNTFAHIVAPIHDAGIIGLNYMTIAKCTEDRIRKRMNMAEADTWR